MFARITCSTTLISEVNGNKVVRLSRQISQRAGQGGNYLPHCSLLLLKGGPLAVNRVPEKWEIFFKTRITQLAECFQSGKDYLAYFSCRFATVLTHAASIPDITNVPLLPCFTLCSLYPPTLLCSLKIGADSGLMLIFSNIYKSEEAAS